MALWKQDKKADLMKKKHIKIEKSYNDVVHSTDKVDAVFYFSVFLCIFILLLSSNV